MCSQARSVAMAILGLLAGDAAAAQRSDVAWHRARADSLAAEWRRAVQARAQAESLAQSRALAGRDTVRAGALILLVGPGVSAARLDPAARRAWALLDSVFGDSTRGLADRPFLVDTVGRPHPRSDIALEPDAGVDQIARLLVVRVPQLYAFGADRELTTWLGNPLTLSFDGAAADPRLYIDLVTAPSRAVRGCFLGSVAACRSALDLEPGGDAFLTWYDADERRDVVQTFRFYLDRPATRATVAACVGARRDAACIELLRSLPPGSLVRPLPPAARLALVRLALQLGGRDAYQRLVSHTGDPLARRLAVAAGVGGDSLVARWRREVLAARPRRVTTSAGGVALALVWAGLFAICGLRSSRWRAG